jgi:uncharacterized protein
MADRTNGASGLAKAAMTIAIIGAINWGLIGFFNWNLVDAIFGGGARETTSVISRVIYAIVGLCGVVAAFMLPRMRPARREPAGAPYGARAEVRP